MRPELTRRTDPPRLVVGGRDLSRLFTVTSAPRPVVPELEITEVSVPGADRSYVSGVAAKAYDWPVTGYINGWSDAEVADVRRKLDAALYSPTEREVQVPDDPALSLMALYKGGSSPERHRHLPTVDLIFRVTDPIAYGRSRRAEVAGTDQIMTGGTWPARPVVTATPPAGSSWTIMNRTTGEFVRVRADFDGRQTVELDMGLERCRVNGYDHAVDVESDFFAISGKCEVYVSGGTAALEWRERWV